MALDHKWDVKNDFAYVLQLFSLISDSLGGVYYKDFVSLIDHVIQQPKEACQTT